MKASKITYNTNTSTLMSVVPQSVTLAVFTLQAVIITVLSL